MANMSCCTCASILAPPSYNFADEKKQPSTSDSPARRLPCCQRAICSACTSRNPRFESYCPFCQVSTRPTPLPQGLRDPPAYSLPSSPKRTAVSTAETAHDLDEDLPCYAELEGGAGNRPSRAQQQEDVVHHLHATDTMTSLSLAYKVPAPILRRHNGVFHDNMLAARKTVLVPASHYSGPSLSDQPVESEEETERKSRIRKFMVGAKCSDYSMAELYLANAQGDVDLAVERWWEDDRWEKEHPLMKEKGKGRKGGIGSGLSMR